MKKFEQIKENVINELINIKKSMHEYFGAWIGTTMESVAYTEIYIDHAIEKIREVDEWEGTMRIEDILWQELYIGIPETEEERVLNDHYRKLVETFEKTF